MNDQPDDELIRGERFERLFRTCREIVSDLQRTCGSLDEHREDMEQEMALTLAELPAHCTDSYCLCRAAWAALAWLRTWFGTKLVRRIHTRPDVAQLADAGLCQLIWVNDGPCHGGPSPDDALEPET